MNAQRFSIGLDIGSSSVKGVLISDLGEVVDDTSAPYETSRSAHGIAEQSPDSWWNAVGEVAGRLAQKFTVSAPDVVVGLTGQMHTSVLRGESGELLRPAILWSDRRAEAEARQLLIDYPRWAEVAGNVPIAAFTSAHLRWVADHQPAIHQRVASVAVPKDEIRHRMGAGWATEPSDASAMNLMDTHTDQWSNELLDATATTTASLAPIVASESFTGEIRNLPSATDHVRPLLGAPVIAGGGDQAAQAIALGVDDDGIGLSIGTSGVAFRSRSTPQIGAFRHVVPGRWLSLNSTHAAGLALSWWAGISHYDIADFSRLELTPLTSRPTFLPYIQGQRHGRGAPGVLHGLQADHTRDDLARGVLEGIAFELTRLVRSISPDDLPDSPIGIGGRAGQIPLLRLLLATTLDRPVFYSNRTSAFGAALLASKARGWDAQFRSLDRERVEVTDPDHRNAAWLTERLENFTHLTTSLT